MHAVIFDLDHTIFDSKDALREGAHDLLDILHRLGVRVGGISANDHRALVRLDEAGLSAHFDKVLCADQTDQFAPKHTDGLHHLLRQLGAEPHEAVLVSHAHADILLGKEALLARTIGVSHGSENARSLSEAGADHVVPSIPAVLDVLG
jgi:phosphoglycolate phosphatase-like HAD superfamily hydrolase